MDSIFYVELNSDNFFPDSLDGFCRRQTVKRCWRKSGGGYALMPVTYTEDWSLPERRETAEQILHRLSSGAIAYGAVENGNVVGFALIIGDCFGSEKQYVDLAAFYVSEPYRRRGIGRRLFHLSCAAAKKFGAEKLYISAHSAEESIAAYKSYGCTFAKEINEALARKEPCDLQLEFALQ